MHKKATCSGRYQIKSDRNEELYNNKACVLHKTNLTCVKDATSPYIYLTYFYYFKFLFETKQVVDGAVLLKALSAPPLEQ